MPGRAERPVNDRAAIPVDRPTTCLAGRAVTEPPRVRRMAVWGQAMARLVGFYPGSFDPLTNGHLDVIERACKLVDELIVGVGVNLSKKPLFSHADRIKLLKQTLEPIGKRTETEFKVVDFSGLMVTAARSAGAKLIIRGLRDTTDYNFEMQMVGMNAQMAPDLQTVFLPSSPHVRHISATLVREIAQLGGDISAFVPANVLKALKSA